MRGQHFTRNTVEAEAWCNKHGNTMHRVDGVKKGPCLKCIAERDQQHEAPKKEKPAKQENLF